jgi:hypothetical protein
MAFSEKQQSTLMTNWSINLKIDGKIERVPVVGYLPRLAFLREKPFTPARGGAIYKFKNVGGINFIVNCSTGFHTLVESIDDKSFMIRDKETGKLKKFKYENYLELDWNNEELLKKND